MFSQFLDTFMNNTPIPNEEDHKTIKELIKNLKVHERSCLMLKLEKNVNNTIDKLNSMQNKTKDQETLLECISLIINDSNNTLEDLVTATHIIKTNRSLIENQQAVQPAVQQQEPQKEKKPRKPRAKKSKNETVNTI